MKAQLKALNINSVQKVAEDIMLKKGWTTTLEVKEALRKSGFFAIQLEVSSAMDFLAWENEWSFNSNGTYRVYQFGEDTELGLYSYMDRGDQFWEIAVKDNYQIIRVGKKNKKATCAKHCYSSNREAIIEAGRLIDLRVNEGFDIREVKEDFSHQVLDHFEFLTKDLLQCTLYYHSVKKEEQQKVLFNTTNGHQPGFINTVKKTGYEFTFDFGLVHAASQLRSALQEKRWEALETTAMSFFLLGEKIIKKEASLTSGASAKLHDIAHYLSKRTTTSVEVRNACLYRIDLQAKDGTNLVLRKDQFEGEQMLFDLTQCLLRTV